MVRIHMYDRLQLSRMRMESLRREKRLGNNIGVSLHSAVNRYHFVAGKRYAMLL